MPPIKQDQHGDEPDRFRPDRERVASFLPGPPIDRTRVEGWRRWTDSRGRFLPAPVLTREQFEDLSPRGRRIHNLHRLATHSNLPILATPMSRRVFATVKDIVEDGAFSHKAGTRSGVMVNGGGAQGKTETVCGAIAQFEQEWLEVHGFADPDAMPGTRDLLAPVVYVRCPVKATPISLCKRVLDFFGEDYKNMRQDDIIRTVHDALTAHATKALVIDDITRLKLHRESDQDVLDLILEMMSMCVTLVLVGVGVRTSGLLRRGRFDPVDGKWLIRPVKDRGRSPNTMAATSHERRFELADLDPFSYDSPQQIADWVAHLEALEGSIRLLEDTEGMLTGGSMPEYLFARTGGVVGVLERLLQRGCRMAIQEHGETLTESLLDRCVLSPTDLPELDADSGEQPVIPKLPKKPKPGRNTVFDDRGPSEEQAG